jgi:Domain of unknown function (DUF4430)
MSRRLVSRAVLLSVLALALALVAGGCGAGAGDRPDEVKLTVTDGFGARTVLDRPGADVRGDDTVMRLLQRNAEVQTRFGGGFVQSIGDLRGGREDGRPVDWFYFVNGVLAERGAASVDVHAGDRIWWDRHDWGGASRIPAVVGSYPEPFVNGRDGERLPTRLECDEGVDAACDAIVDKLAKLGIVAGKSRLGTEKGEEYLRILVGRWPELRGDLAAEQLEQGPKTSGVYARISEDGKTITALDPRGRAVRRLGAGAGLIAATRWRDEDPVWVVTGTDAAGVELAAKQAFDESVLNEKFALAVDDGLPVPLPVTERSP